MNATFKPIIYFCLKKCVHSIITWITQIVKYKHEKSVNSMRHVYSSSHSATPCQNLSRFTENTASISWCCCVVFGFVGPLLHWVNRQKLASGPKCIYFLLLAIDQSSSSSWPLLLFAPYYICRRNLKIWPSCLRWTYGCHSGNNYYFYEQ